MNAIQSAIKNLVNGKDLEKGLTENVMEELMSGEATDAQIGAFLTALNAKGETPEEIAGCAKIMRQFATQIDPEVSGKLVDTCGTGGDELNTFNISTSAMFVAAGAGIPIAKHGNRSVTSKSGSADVLETLGVQIDLPPREVKKCIEEIGIGFMFAPRFHKAMKHAIGPRKEIELRSVFNVLGPLTNPAEAEAQVMGVFDKDLTEKLAKVLGKLGCKNGLVVYGLDGLDEISTVGKTRITELEKRDIETYEIEPEDFGISTAKPKEISGGNARKNAEILLRVLHGVKGPKRDIVLLNSAAAIYVSGKANSIDEGSKIAKKSIESGRALSKLKDLVKLSGGNSDKLKELEESL